jgi:hypothetical protein
MERSWGLLLLVAGQRLTARFKVPGFKVEVTGYLFLVARLKR